MFGLFLQLHDEGGEKRFFFYNKAKRGRTSVESVIGSHIIRYNHGSAIY